MTDANVGNLPARMAADLRSTKSQSQFRSLDTPAGINLCSNDYLGLARDPRLKQAVLASFAACSQFGSTGSRLLSGNSCDWEDLESEFAEFAGAEAALYFGSGYAANVGLLSSILQPADTVFSDSLNHASLIDGIRLSPAQKIVYPHADLQRLEDALRRSASPAGARLIVTESVFSMEGDIVPLAAILQLAERYDAYVIVDEAHSLGVFGEEGRGFVAGLPDRSRVLAAVYPCGKALASIGAFVCCGRDVKDFLVNHARTFIFSTATPPYMAHQIRAALNLSRSFRDRREHLQRISVALRSALSVAGVDYGSSATQIVPVILGSNEAALHAASALQSAGFAVKAIRPPTVPSGAARIRLSLTSEISLTDVHRLAQLLGEVVRSARYSSSAVSAHA